MTVQKPGLGVSAGMFSPESGQTKLALKRITDALSTAPFSEPADPGLKSIFICMTPRSGSSYLSSVLFANRVGRFSEHFRTVGGSMEKALQTTDGNSFESYVRGLVAERKSKKNIFGAKVDWLQFAPLYYFGAYDHLFRDAKFVYLTRNDILSQAISRYIATQTGYFHSTNKAQKSTQDKDVEFDFDRLWSHAEHLLSMQTAWESFFACEDLKPLRISYEEVETNTEGVLRRIGTHCNVPLPEKLVIETDYKRVRNERHERMRELAIAEVRRRRQQYVPTPAATSAERAAG